MKLKYSPSLAWLTILSVLFSFCAGILLTDIRAHAESESGSRTPGARGRAIKKDKVAPDLRELLKSGHGSQRINVIIQSKGTWNDSDDVLVQSFGAQKKQTFENLNASLVELPANAADVLASLDEVSYISLDNEIHSLGGHVATTTGANLVRQQSSPGGTAYTLDGKGVGIAIMDSGIFTSHQSFLDASGKSRITYNKDFTGEKITNDKYGHGSHVAALAAGNGLIAAAAYIGIAPNASLINLRVLNSQGTGTISSVLSAINWTLTYGATYNIKVVNMSLGSSVVNSYRNDPLCQAVRKLADAGIVVVAAAGNDGKDSSGQKRYGSIHAPGNEPSAITVGAANTYGTDARNDDTVTTYSSRGPTRSYWTDLVGAKHYDNLVKPDLIAPGNKLISAEADKCTLVTNYPQLDAKVATDKSRKMMRLNGTSMAAPIVSGAAALLLQANPKLTPNMVKMILMYTAQQLNGFNMLEQGTGELNIEGAVRLAKLVRGDLTWSTTAAGTQLLTADTLPTPATTIAGYIFVWAQGLNIGQTHATGVDLITRFQKIYGTGVLLSDGVLLGDGVLLSDSTMMSLMDTVRGGK